MVNIKRFPWVCAGILISISVHAADPVSYQIGDKAQDDIKASVPFDVVDIRATAELKASKARTIAAIYRHETDLKNVIANQFLASYAKAHRNFTNALAATYHEPVIDDATIVSSDFGSFLTAFNERNKNFPVTAELGVAWARGSADTELLDKWLGLLVQTMSGPVQPDKLPPHFPIYGRKVRIMPVANKNEKFTFQVAWRKGYVITTNIPTISSVRTKFRRQFSEHEQPLAQALAQLLQPNCIPEPTLTQEGRDFTVQPIVVSDHFDAGQIIVHRGATIDANDIAALDAMNKALMPGALSQQVAAAQQRAQQEQARADQEKARAEREQEQAQNEHNAALMAQQQQQQEKLAREQAQSQAQQESENATAMREQAQNLAQKIHERNEWLLATLGVVSILALAVLWRLIRKPAAPTSAPARLVRIEKNPTAVSTELAPILTQTLKEAVVQGLAAQRAELLEVQRMAAAEIAALVHRLDQLQVPMQERLRAYQDRIVELQKELAEKTQENRELLKLKIEMMREQLESERGRRMKLN